MNKDQIDKIEKVLKVLEKAKWDNQSIADQQTNLKILGDFAKAVTELKQEITNSEANIK